jgi:hypothetical protein
MRAAFCLSGIARAIPVSYHWIQKYYIKPYNCDVFFRSWTTTEFENDHSPYKAIELYDPKGSELEDYDESRFKRLVEQASNEPERLAKAVDANRHRVFAMWWQVAQCFNLVEKSLNNYGMNYDVIFRGRPDGYYITKFDFNNVQSKTLYILGSKFNDGFAAGDFRTMQEYTRLFYRYPSYLHKYSNYPVNHWLCPHLLQEFHLQSMEMQGYTIVRLKDNIRAGKIWAAPVMAENEDPFERAKFYEREDPI